MRSRKTTKIIFTALFTAIICVLSQISFVTPSVPVTLQTFAVALCGYTLSVKWAFASIVTYVIIGTAGLPVFANFRGGVQMLTGPTGGFIIGFIFLAVFCALASGRKWYLNILLSVAGLAICHAAGVLQYSFSTGNGVAASFLTSSLPFIVKDILSLAGAWYLSRFVLQRLKVKL